MSTEIDHDALRARYAEERAKRIRPDGDRQYIEPTESSLCQALVSMADRAR